MIRRSSPCDGKSCRSAAVRFRSRLAGLSVFIQRVDRVYRRCDAISVGKRGAVAERETRAAWRALRRRSECNVPGVFETVRCRYPRRFNSSCRSVGFELEARIEFERLRINARRMDQRRPSNVVLSRGRDRAHSRRAARCRGTTPMRLVRRSAAGCGFALRRWIWTRHKRNGSHRGRSLRTAAEQATTLRATSRSPRQIRGNNQHSANRKRMSRMRNITGCANAAQRPANTARSSPIDANQLLNGSGDVLINMRVPALVACVAAVTLPPTRPAATTSAGVASPTAPAASMAPAGILMNVCSASHVVSTPGSCQRRIPRST